MHSIVIVSSALLHDKKQVAVQLIQHGLTDLFNGTFSTNRLYCAFNKYVAVKKVKLMIKLTMSCVGNTYNKPLQ